MSACADTKYKSVFVMSEEKDECIIATEVSFASCGPSDQSVALLAWQTPHVFFVFVSPQV